MNVLHTRWRALVLALLLAVSLAVPAAAAEPQAAAADLQTTADTAAAYAAQYGGAQSLQYALWQDGEIVLTGQTGTFSRSENRLMTGDELYGIGSVSKIYTTVAVMQLAEDGKVSLDAPVTRYLPDFKMADERYKDITVRMLLNHSSGILGTGLSDAMLFGEASTRAHDTLLEKLSTQRLAADPGSFSVYCNDGFSLAELVVEAVTDMDFMDYVDEHILAPLDLDRTFAPGGDFDANDLAPIYRGTDPRALPQDALNAIGAGGIYATASDLASFGGALTGTELLRQSSLDAMAFPEYSRGLWPDSGEPDSLAYGLGWDNMEWYPFCQSDIQALVKGGDTLYYHAGLVVLPEYDMAAAVVSSGGVSTYDQLAANQILIAALAEEGVTVDQAVKALPAAESAAMPAEQLENAGYYGSTSAQYQVDIQADGTLTMSYLNYPTSIPAQTFTYCSRGLWPESGEPDSLAYGLGWDNMEWYPFCQSDIQALVKGGDTLYYHAGLVVLPEYDMAAAVVSSGGVSTYDQLAANQILIAALAEEGVTVDQAVKALPAAESAAMPAEQLENAGYYGSTSAQYQVDIQADGTLTMSYLNYPTSIPAQTFTYCSDGSFRDSTGLSYISFVKERNGQTYLYQQAVSPLPGLGALPIANYAAVKLPENDLSPEVAAAWDSIATLGILPMNEPYNSQTFLALADAAAVAEVPETIPGYIGAARIADETTARSEIQVPGVGSRDGVDYQLEERDGVLWINAKGSLYMDAAAAPTLFTGSGASYTTIQADGYARWYQVGDAAGKTMTVQVPENSGFWVYDGNGQVTASSVLWGDTTVTLPEDGTIVFAGDPGARFHLRFQG